MAFFKELKLIKTFNIVGLYAVLLWVFNSAALAQVLEPDEHDFMIAGPEDILPQDDTGWVYCIRSPK